MKPQLKIQAALLSLMALGLTSTAEAFSAGIDSSQFNSLTGCNQCHSGGTTPSVVLSGPSIVRPGGNNITLTLSVLSAGAFGGLNVAPNVSSATASLLLSFGSNGTGTKTIFNAFAAVTEITHSQPRNFGSTGRQFDFQLRAPAAAACNSNVTLTGWGLAADGSGVSGDRGAKDTHLVRVVCPPTIATTASPGVALGAGTLRDTAIVTGRNTPIAGGMIDFRLYGPDNVNCTGSPIFESLDVPYPAAGGSVTSGAFTPTAPGTYRWRATYNPDANNFAVAGLCNDANENVIVTRATPTIATTASSSISLGGGQLSDSAVVSGRFGPLAGASIDFRLYGPDDATCQGAPVFESLDVAYPVAGGSVASAAFTPAFAGTYRWRATYGGDANNAPVTGACNAPNETATVARFIPVIATTASGNITIGVAGASLSDSAVVSRRVNPQAGARIDFRLYGPNDNNCGGTPVFQSLNVSYPVAGGAVNSASYVPTIAGTYRWRATYSGDANNAPVAGACNAPNENVDVYSDDFIFGDGFEGP